MQFPIDTTMDGCAFALRCGYDHDVYPRNIGKGGEHYPATSVIEIYGIDSAASRR